MSLAILLSLTGCLLVSQAELTDDQVHAPTLTRSEFRSGYAEVWCETLADCDLLLDAGFESEAQCVVTYDDALDSYLSDPDCLYDGEAAASCLEGLIDAQCEDITTDSAPAACGQVCG